MSRNKILLVVVLATVIGVATYLKQKTNETSIYLSEEAHIEKRLEDIKVPAKMQTYAALADTSAADREQAIQIEFKKCFNKEIKLQSLEGVKSALLQQRDFSAPALSEENFELTTDDKRNLVVQHIPMEENRNKVRVFLINPADGLPDRIKDFPNSEAELALRLKGALSMGTVKTKTTSTTQNSYDGSLLSMDLENEKVVRIHLITTSFDFECKEQSCQCLKKE